MTPKVTVLMTVYNGQRYLKECMDSVLSQTFKEFEFLIVDDCSADSSMDMINSCRDSRIRIIKNEKNLGQVVSLNIGLSSADGEYVARMDQDDVISKHRLARQVEFLHKRPDISVAGTWGEAIDEKGDAFASICLPVRNEEIAATALFAGHFLLHSSVIFRKDHIVEAGKYNEDFCFAEDYDLWTRLLLKGRRFVNIPAPLIKFRCHKKSSSKNFFQRQLANARHSVLNFIKNIDAQQNSSVVTDALCDILINMGIINRDFFTSDAGRLVRPEDITNLLECILKKMQHRLSFNASQTYLMKKIFYNRMLNFIFCGRRTKTPLAESLYSYCLANYIYILANPKFYLYPLASLFAKAGKKNEDNVCLDDI